jgi:hypothetical protein
MWPLLLLLVAGLAILVGLRRANELFVVDLGGGRARLARGRVPPRLLADLEDVARAAPGARGRVRVVVRSATPAVVVRGAIDEGTAQRVRNVVGQFRLAELRTGRPRGRRG